MVGYDGTGTSLSFLGTAAGTIGTTITVALMESAAGPKLWSDPAAFSSAQPFAFACLVPIGVLAVLIAFNSRLGVEPTAGAPICIRH